MLILQSVRGKTVLSQSMYISIIECSSVLLLRIVLSVDLTSGMQRFLAVRFASLPPAEMPIGIDLSRIRSRLKGPGGFDIFPGKEHREARLIGWLHQPGSNESHMPSQLSYLAFENGFDQALLPRRACPCWKPKPFWCQQLLGVGFDVE